MSNRRTLRRSRSSAANFTWWIWLAVKRYKNKHKSGCLLPHYDTVIILMSYFSVFCSLFFVFVNNRSVKLEQKELFWMKPRTSTSLCHPWGMSSQLWLKERSVAPVISAVWPKSERMTIQLLMSSELLWQSCMGDSANVSLFYLHVAHMVFDSL